MNISKPSSFNILEKAKYDAWKEAENLTKEESAKKYVEIIDEAYEDWYKP